MEEDLIYIKEYMTREQTAKSILEKAPQLVYKYRHWKDPYHSDTLTIPTIYFSHINGLNDPHDIHIPLEFDVGEIDDPRFFEKVKEVGTTKFPRLIPGTVPFMAECVNLMENIRKDPQGYFQKNYADVLKSGVYDCYGVFSTTENELSTSLWAYYGKDHSGFCVGYAPLDIMNYVVCSIGRASYRDKLVKHSFLNPSGPEQMVNDFIKGSELWGQEKEFRFVTVMIQNDDQRIVTVPRNFIKEVVVGFKITDADLTAIKETLLREYGGQVPLYQTNIEIGGYGLEKHKINY